MEEVARNLVLDGRASDDQAARLAAAMGGAFDGAAVPEDAMARLEPAMTDDPRDGHVLAAAVASEAQAIVTFNLKDFPPEACEPFAIEAIHPDDFLLDLYELLIRRVGGSGPAGRRPPTTADDEGRAARPARSHGPALRSRAPVEAPMRHVQNGVRIAATSRREPIVGRSSGHIRGTFVSRRTSRNSTALR
jgi:hypothetical protein